MKQRITELLSILNTGVYEKETEIKLALLAAISGESIFLLGPPGTAKSEVARRLKLVFQGASSFEYLMSRFSTPDEIFGPVSISKLKNEDTYERNVQGFLPTADVVFLDEIWKAGPAIQNSLLTVINERIFRNGTHTLNVPMKCLIAASNELPAKDEGLEALWDRFLIRVVSNCIQDEERFFDMLELPRSQTFTISATKQIDEMTLQLWQCDIEQITIAPEVFECISVIRAGLNDMQMAKDAKPQDYYISDRRWRKCFQVLRTSAYLNERKSIDLSDIPLLCFMLWNTDAAIEKTFRMVISALFADLTAKAKELECRLKPLAEENPRPKSNDTSAYQKYSQFYIFLPDYGENGAYLWAPDYEELPIQQTHEALVYYDIKMQGYVIRDISRASNIQAADNADVKRVKIQRQQGGIFVNMIFYAIQRRQESAPEYDRKLPTRSPVPMIIKAVNNRREMLLANIFTTTPTQQMTDEIAGALIHRMEVCEVRIGQKNRK